MKIYVYKFMGRNSAVTRIETNKENRLKCLIIYIYPYEYIYDIYEYIHATSIHV